MEGGGRVLSDDPQAKPTRNPWVGLGWGPAGGGLGAGLWDMFWYRVSAQILQDAVLFKATV